MSYVLKEKPEDFVVEEKISFDPLDKGRYTYFWLEKKDFSTPEAIKRISRALKVPTKFLSYAGLKDKRAVTKQLCCVEGVFPKKIEQLDLDNISLRFAGFADRPLGRGRLTGNHFRIVVRNLKQVPELTFTQKSFPNYFGTQRFQQDNVLVGKLLLTKNFKEAALLISQRHHVELVDPITTLKKIPRSSLSLYVHSYQSWLFNETLRELIRNSKEIPPELPLVGFGTEEIPQFMKDLMKTDNINSRSFICRQIPLLSSEGGSRKTFVEATSFSSKTPEKDECYPNSQKVTIEFDLPAGSYATEFISFLFEKQ